MSHILAGDIGGTRARFAIFDVAGRRLVHQDVLESRSFASFEATLDRYLEGARAAMKSKMQLRAASFGIAGPIVEQRVKTTNLPWVIDARTIAKRLRVEKVTLLNDLVAVGLGAIASPPSKLAVLHLGRPKKTGGNLAVIAAGTGLGEASFIWDGETHVPCPTEGSHVDFAPRNAMESKVLEALANEYGHVSYERVASGSTIKKLYRFFLRALRQKETKEAAAFIARAADPNAAIVDLAEEGRSEAAAATLTLWASVYGAEAGNLALKCLATSGVYVCGGVSVRLASFLARGFSSRRGGRTSGTSPFLEAFVDKGRMRPLLEKIPVAICLEPRAGILGAANHAAKQVRPRTGR